MACLRLWAAPLPAARARRPRWSPAGLRTC